MALFSVLTQQRKGVSLVELLLFIAVISVVALALFPLLFSTTEDRLLQQTISIVEQSGQQILQTIGQQVRHSEKIILPEQGGTGTILHLQTGSGGTNPVIIGLSTGAVILIQGTKQQTLSSGQVAVEQLVFTPTSASAQRQSVLVKLRLSRTIRLQAPRIYRQDFEALFAPFSDDVQTGATCGCASPGCGDPTSYVWQVCTAGVCSTAQTQLQCP